MGIHENNLGTAEISVEQLKLSNDTDNYKRLWLKMKNGQSSVLIAYKFGELRPELTPPTSPKPLSLSSTKARLLLENEEYITLTEELNDTKTENSELSAKLEMIKKE
jgi:hypothetical protein